MSQDLLSVLLDPNHSAFESSWSSLFTDIGRVRSLIAAVPTEQASPLLAAGQLWRGEGFNSSKAAMLVYTLTGVPLVRSTWTDYRTAFLYALSLVLEVEVPELDLDQRVADVSFTLAQAFSGQVDSAYYSQPGEPGSSPTGGTTFSPPEDNSTDDSEELMMTWDEPKADLPQELAFLWQETSAGNRKLDLKLILNQVPRYRDLPGAAPINNHRADGLAKRDKEARAQQQQLLHSLRLLTHAYTRAPAGADSMLVPLQQLFQLLTELYHRLGAQRKADSIPGCLPPAGEVLFAKEELQNAAQKFRINRLGKGIVMNNAYGRLTNFPSCPAGKGKGFSAGKGYGGRGYKPFYRPYRPWFGKGKGSNPGKGMMTLQTPREIHTSPLPQDQSEECTECFLQGTSEGPALVEEPSPTSSGAINTAWRQTARQPASFFIKIGSKKGWGRNHESNKDYGRILTSGSCQNGQGQLYHKTSGPLVHHYKKGKSRRKSKIDCRLPGNQHLFSNKTFQVGPPPKYIPSFKTRHVGSKSRLKACLFSHKSSKRTQTLYKDASGRKSLGISRSLFWSQCFATTFHDGYENLPEKMGCKRSANIHLSGRHSSPWNNKKSVQHHLDIMLQDLKDSGMQINFSKSIVHPSQTLPHLGFILDLQRGRLLVPPEKLKMVRKELGKIVTKDTMTVRKMSAILGQIRSFLTALPFLRAFTDHLVLFIKNSTNWGWDHQVQIPLDLKIQLKNLTIMFQKWEGRPFLTTRLHRKMAADSSDWAWGGIDLTSGHCLQEFWRSQAGLHINVKEVLAAIHTVKSFAKKNEKVFLLVDNTTTFWYLKKQGGKIDKFNNLLRPFILWCLDKNIDLQVQLVKSAEMPADHLSRMPKDKGDYTLNHPLFLHMWSLFKPHLIPFQEMTDMFASPGNAKFKRFYCRHPHWQSVGTDSLNSPLHHLKFCYSNPPWSIIRNWLHRLLQFPELICWTVVPYWVSSSWFPLLKKLIVPKSPIWVVKPFQGMFQNCYAELMPKPRWPLLFCLLSGKCFRGNKFRLKPKTLIWQN